MKKLFYFAFALLMGATIVSCSSDDNSTELITWDNSKVPSILPQFQHFSKDGGEKTSELYILQFNSLKNFKIYPGIGYTDYLDSIYRPHRDDSTLSCSDLETIEDGDTIKGEWFTIVMQKGSIPHKFTINVAPNHKKKRFIKFDVETVKHGTRLSGFEQEGTE